ncbi:MAG: AzlC family ABC transporter permease [Thermanaerothrix sp.]|uniref:AzlC family ABC transporter permease n=1 Tax=Thermanaerothrix sp. TaxID=2972675 RepID=UPI003C7AB6D0
MNKWVRNEFMRGVQAFLPLLVGVVPFGLITGIAVSQTGISPNDGIIMSLLVYSGAALLVALQLIQLGTPILITILSALMVNLRFLMYSASLAPHFQKLSSRWKILLAYLLSDQAYAVSISYLEDPSNQKTGHWYFLGAAITMWLTWQGSLFLGMVVGVNVPPGWSLDFTVPLTFLALAVPTVKDKSTLFSALVASLAALLMNGLPFKIGVVIAAIIGIGIGAMVDEWRSS